MRNRCAAHTKGPKLLSSEKAHKGRERLSVDEDFELHPADVVEVTIGADDANGEVAGE